MIVVFENDVSSVYVNSEDLTLIFSGETSPTNSVKQRFPSVQKNLCSHSDNYDFITVYPALWSKFGVKRKLLINKFIWTMPLELSF